MPSRPVHLIGVPLDLGASRRGVDMGPSAVRISGLGERLRRLGHPVVDRGDIATPGLETRSPGSERKRYIGEIAEVCGRVYAAVRLEFPILSLHPGLRHRCVAPGVWPPTTRYAATRR